MKEYIFLNVVRNEFSDNTTLGELYVNGKFFCYTIEDTLRSKGLKIPKVTCICDGIYNVVLSMSNRFKRMLPLVQDVPQFTGIRFHGGNTAKDSEGCIILGYNKISKERIYDSTAVKDLVVLLSQEKRPIKLVVSNDY